MHKDTNIYRNSKNSKFTVYDLALQYIRKRYDLVYNEVSVKYLIRLKGNNNEWSQLNENSLLIELNQAEIDIRLNKLLTLIKSDNIRKFNPFKEYFNQLKWDGIDHIKLLSNYIPINFPDEFETQLKKWCVRAVKCLFENSVINKHCIVFVDKNQHTGKTSFCNWLVPDELKEYSTQNIGTSKDDRIQMAKNFIILFDDMDRQSRSTIGSFKSFISQVSINERLPYDRTNTHISRKCSYLGTTNELSFLQDDTGSVRWLCFELLDKINFAYSDDINVNDIWAQAYHLAYQTEYKSELTNEEIKRNEKRNELYREMTIEEEYLRRFYEPSDDKAHFNTASDVVLQLKQKYPQLSFKSDNMGRALTKLCGRRVRNKDIYGYRIKKIKS